jgi:hypothetical protein
MSEKMKIGPDKAAVLIMDCQTDIIGILGTNEVDSCLSEKIFPRQAAVVAAEEFLGAIRP